MVWLNHSPIPVRFQYLSGYNKILWSIGKFCNFPEQLVRKFWGLQGNAFFALTEAAWAPTNQCEDPECLSWNTDPDFSIPDPGSKGIGYRNQIRNPWIPSSCLEIWSRMFILGTSSHIRIFTIQIPESRGLKNIGSRPLILLDTSE